MNAKSIFFVSALGVAGAANANIVISKFAGGGGNSGAYYNSDFVELLNNSAEPASLSGLSLYYASKATGTFTGTATNAGLLGETTLQPGQYFLVKLNQGTSTTQKPIPTPDATFSTINPASDSGKFLVYRGTGNQTYSALDPTKVEDLVGYGTASQYEGTSAAPIISNTLADVRALGGLQDTNDNGIDFTSVTADASLTINNSSSAFAPVQSVPEPGSLAALGLGALGLVKRRRKA